MPIPVQIETSIPGRPLIAQRLDTGKYVTLNLSHTDHKRGDKIQTIQERILSEHDTYIGALDKLEIQPI